MKPLKLELDPHLEFRLRTMQQSAQGLSNQQAIDLVCDLLRQNFVLQSCITDLLKP